MKTLIDARAVEAMKAQGQTTVWHNNDVLITPQARDMIRDCGMTIREGEADQPQAQACCPQQMFTNSGVVAPAACRPETVSSTAAGIVHATMSASCAPQTAGNPQSVTAASLNPQQPQAQVCQPQAAQPQANGGALDSDTVIRVLKSLAEAGLLKTLLEAADRASKPYDAAYDDAGFKLVHGATVKKEPLDTGNPADQGKVNYQEIIGSDDGAGFGCGLIDMENVCFNWQTECQEAYYIVSGTISVTIAGKTYAARPGDAFFMKKGLSCAFSAQGKASAFCVTY